MTFLCSLSGSVSFIIVNKLEMRSCNVDVSAYPALEQGKVRFGKLVSCLELAFFFLFGEDFWSAE